MKMNKDMFWKTIEEANLTADNNNHNEFIRVMEKILMRFSLDDIVEWNNIKEYYMELAYRNDLWIACMATRSHSTDDGFIDFRSWLISRGKKVYIDVLNNPESLAEIDIPVGEANFEEFGYIANIAYENITNLENDDFFEILANYNIWKEKNADTIIAEINTEIKLRPDLDIDINNADFEEIFPILYKKHRDLFIENFNRLYDEGNL